jgi:beta-N-acetylhexosaminidase
VAGVDIFALQAAMTVEQKVGQLLLLGFGGTQMDGTIASFLQEMQPGAVALFSRNIHDQPQTARLITDVRALDPRVVVKGQAIAIPQFVAVDQEGGTVVRLKSQVLVLPSAMALGAADDVELAGSAGAVLGADLAHWGFNMNLAPVLDVNSNPKNPVIGLRAFGGDAERVAALGVAYIEGMLGEGVLPVAKHFPGHGDTDVDSHYGLPALGHDRARLDTVELLPFAAAIAAGAPAFMTAHIALPAVAEDSTTPATVSPAVLTGVLRDDLGFDGIVMTDGLEMQGIVDLYGSGEAAVRAVVAGADMVMVLWLPEKKREVRQALLAAVKSGRIPQARLDQAVRRVLEQKARAGLFAPHAPRVAQDLAKRRRAVVQEVAQRAVTVARNVDNVLPLRADARVVAAAPVEAFLNQLVRLHGQTTTLQLPSAPTRERTAKDAERLVELAREADVVVVGLATFEQAAIVRRLKQAHPQLPIVVVSFGSPYLAQALPAVEAYVCAFGWRQESGVAVADVLAGRRRPQGRMPVVVPGLVQAEARAR